ncbi:DUF2726 domain-containing protein [Thermus igniterrae]|jgi:hypothetical protein|uniref:DUF2726 domain-containing protein n=1 Tax=Thermus igniterrae TaxID=88189 RepID=UPI000A03086C|nr:DUF2726 domain-containing protein [Thermus igniterrae]
MEVLFFVFILLGAMAILLGLRGAHREKKHAEASKTPASLPYKLKPALLSPAERSFWGVLQKVLPNEHLVWPKVRLLDLLLVDGEGGQRLSALNRVQAKHLDFLVVRARDARPILAIELDDRSHQRPDRQERDRFIDELMQKVGLPLVRIQARHAYAPEALKALLAPHLEADGASSNDPLRPR